MPRRATVEEIQRPSAKEAKAPNFTWCDTVTDIPPKTSIPTDSSTSLQTGNMWAYALDGFCWVHMSAVICVTPEINTHFITNIPTSEGE